MSRTTESKSWQAEINCLSVRLVGPNESNSEIEIPFSEYARRKSSNFRPSSSTISPATGLSILGNHLNITLS